MILIDDLEEFELSRYSDKKLVHEKISLTNNYVDIEFSFKYTSKNSINLNQCSINDVGKGFYMFLMSGKLDDKFNILFETATIPKIFGPFCLNSCSKTLNLSTNELIVTQSPILRNQEKKQTNNLKNSSIILNTEILLNESKTTTNESSVYMIVDILSNTSSTLNVSSSISKNLGENNFNFTQTNITVNTTTSTYLTTTTTSITLPTNTTEIIKSTALISESLEFNSTELNGDFITSSQDTNTQPIIVTNDPVTYQDVSQQTQTASIQSSTMTSSSIKFCSDKVQNLSNLSLEFIYDNRVQTFNFTLTFNLNYDFTRIGVFNDNPEINVSMKN